MKLRIIAGALALVSCLAVSAQSHMMEVNTKKIGAPVQPTMYGLFFEDINYAADGGLYGELVKNRSFEFPDHLMGWEAFGKFEVEDDGPFERCPHYVQLRDPGHKERRSGLSNNGFFGIGLHQGEDYRFSVWARAPHGTGQIIVQFIDRATMEEHQEFAETKLTINSPVWKQYEVVMKSPRTIAKAQLRIFLDGKNGVDLEHVSLFPVNTFKNRKNGMRRDLAQALADEHPGLLRFPGGCIVEGVDLATRYQWKNTIGPVENRPLNENRWEYTFPYRFYPDYFQSYGLGFFEFFQLSEDIGAEPLPVLNVGMACQFQNWDDDAAHVPYDQLQPYIQDCLDLIEFANGPADSEWGRKRAEMGHPEPFNMKFIGVGNEQWDDLFFKRLEPFVAAIKAKYPNIQIVGTSGPDSEGKMFEKGWDAMKRLKADLVDEHFYRPESWFLGNAEAKEKYGEFCGALRYEHYDRKGPKVFAGEYACHGANGKKWNHYEASILEAAFMTDLERNADVVYMTAYAPLFAHVEGWQWRPDLIWYDNLRSMRTASWHVQQLYGQYKGQNALTLKMNGANVTGAAGQDGLFASAVKDGDKVYVKVINTSDKPREVEFAFNGLKKKDTMQAVECVKFASNLLYEDNTLDDPNRIVPVKAVFSGEGKTLSATVDPLCFTIFVITR